MYDLLRAFGPRASDGQKDWPTRSSATVKNHEEPKSGGAAGRPARGPESGDTSLGDFSKIYKSLGLPQRAPVLARPPSKVSAAIRSEEQEVYASDGFLDYQPSTRSHVWGGEAYEFHEHAQTAPEDERTEDSEKRKKITLKNRRKKEREKKKKKEIGKSENQHTEPLDTKNVPLQSSALDESKQGDTDPGHSGVTNGNEATARASVVTPLHNGIEKPKDDFTLRPMQVTPKAAPTKPAKHPHIGSQSSSTPPINLNLKAAQTPARVSQTSVGANSGSAIHLPAQKTVGNKEQSKEQQDRNIETLKRQAAMALHQSMQTPAPSSDHLTRSQAEKLSGQSKESAGSPTKGRNAGGNIQKAAQTAGPKPVPNTWKKFVQKASDQPGKHAPDTSITEKQSDKPKCQPEKPSTPSFAQSPPENRKSKGKTILPLINQTKTERNWNMLLKLLHNFPDDREHMLNAHQLSINRPQPQGIHVFVDASNILIGYMQHLKLARGISRLAHLPAVYPSFHSLALLLERRRPVAKRVLVGSTPEVASYEEAREIGYETSVLDKVWKVKELTERQKFFARHGPGGKNGRNGSSSDAESSEAEIPLPPQQPKWHEQGVDEVIHMKMMESLVDTPVNDEAPANKPSEPFNRPTMVLATGDAAEAEYSSGFLKMVQRALAKGWYVEVACWGHSLSKEYQRLENSKKGARFKIIKLDSYAEELFPGLQSNGSGS